MKSRNYFITALMLLAGLPLEDPAGFAQMVSSLMV